MNNKSTSLLLAAATMVATIVPAFAADPAPASQTTPPSTQAAPAKTAAAPAKKTKVANGRKKTTVASKKPTEKTAAVKKAK